MRFSIILIVSNIISSSSILEESLLRRSIKALHSTTSADVADCNITFSSFEPLLAKEREPLLQAYDLYLVIKRPLFSVLFDKRFMDIELFLLFSKSNKILTASLSGVYPS